ncbi:MAG: S26 family signal peptidase [Bacteroidales bacterium]|nr:S26 family signal peptidase [Bacteroidales bacterium]
MKKQHKILIIIASIAVVSVVLFFTNFGFYKADVYPGGPRKFLIRKVSNPNMYLNFIKPSAESLIEYGDLIIHKSPELLDPPFSEKENICSRVIAKPGDIVSIVDSKVFVNDKLVEETYDRYFRYRVNTNESMNFQELLKDFKVHIIDSMNNNKACDIITTSYIAEKIEECEGVLNVRKIVESKGTANIHVFPHQSYPWNPDNFGPLIIPGKGVTVSLNRNSINLYKKIIDYYEEHELYIFGENIEIDGVATKQYVVKENYYFVLNDNRYNRDDSRHWGFIPESYIVGKVIN